MGRNLNIYVTDDQLKRMRAIHRALGKCGVKLTDNRGHLSDSRLIREVLDAVDVDALAEVIKAREQKGQGGADES